MGEGIKREVREKDRKGGGEGRREKSDKGGRDERKREIKGR